jgi:hypothetical protein
VTQSTEPERRPEREARTCDSCGAEADDLERVRRLYVTPEAWDTEEKVERTDSVESWCFPCRTHYPYEAVDEA